ncbi:MAG TPA: helix-turn-helix transcriptional regulator [Frankiaceae bacterium]|jgi:transcriptional regulator with XRE-family HTH domain|nr:helix-turn-helix transcriptional regulator [Frankiaceae bacterium]
MRREVPHAGDPPHVRFGRRVRELREAAGIEQQELAQRVGMSGGYLSGIERGARNPTLDVVFAIAHALRVQPAALFQD